jgi:hypothetical protein
MEESNPSSVNSNLPVVLIAALVQGAAFLALDYARHADRLDPAWLTALYSAFLLGPVTVQLLARFARNRYMWVLSGGITGLCCYFGWYEGATQLPAAQYSPIPFDIGPAFALALIVLWLLVLPFIQARLSSGRWQPAYGTLFRDAWRNPLVLAEAGLFTGLFWLLLGLWQALFSMLRIEFFSHLFGSTGFIYPVTTATFGIGLHLIGSIDRLTSIVLEQLLNVLKWLAIVAGCLLTLFTVALAYSLPGLVFAGEHAISAVWLLWLVAVIVLLLNAAFRDGSVDRPYPRWIGVALRWMVPLTVVISATAVYSLGVRTQHYGITVERCWAWIVAGTLFLYCVGYSIAAFNRNTWMGGMARVNVTVAIALMIVIAATLTPAFAPRRLAANSQFARIISQAVSAAEKNTSSGSPFVYLRFDSGSYGLARLKQLAALSPSAPGANDIRRLAAESLAWESRYASEHVAAEAKPAEFRDSLAKARIYPAGRTMVPPLQEALLELQQKRHDQALASACSSAECFGLFVDLNKDGVEEFVLLTVSSGWAFEQHGGQWESIGSVYSEFPAGKTWNAVLDALVVGNYSAVTPQWQQLSIGGRQFRVEADR